MKYIFFNYYVPRARISSDFERSIELIGTTPKQCCPCFLRAVVKHDGVFNATFKYIWMDLYDTWRDDIDPSAL